jgi:hypothetical protein
MSHHRLNDRRRVVADVGLALPAPPSPSRQGGDGFSCACGARCRVLSNILTCFYTRGHAPLGSCLHRAGPWVWDDDDSGSMPRVRWNGTHETLSARR